MTLKQVPGEPAVSTTYTPDGLRESVTDGRGTTSYQYDARRRVTRVDHPDGTWIAYDTLHRLTQVEHLAPDLSLLASYQYTLDAAGNRTQVLQGDGRQITAVETDCSS